MDNLTSALANLETIDFSATAEDSPSDDPSQWPLPIPAPPEHFLLGNMPEMDLDTPLNTFVRLADTYGEIFQLRLSGGQKRCFISTVNLLEEMCDESKFRKVVSGPLYELRSATGAGLFTAHADEKEWGIAHRVLMPAFGPMAIRDMFEDMHDIASQLVLKWARYGPAYKIPATDDFTRLTLDTISLCAMDYRFNSFYSNEMHPFVDAMVRFLVESGRRANRPAIATTLLHRAANRQYEEDVELMKSISRDLVAARRAHPVDKKDLLNAMINGRDPKTGEGLSDELIIANMITFLIAGHETTSGLLSFVFLNLLKHSSAYRAAQQEVDEVCGKEPITFGHMSKLKYLNAVLRETLRLNPTAPSFGVRPYPEYDPPTLGEGKYKLEHDEPVVAVLHKIHRDPKVYGENANEFKPERMLDEKFSKLPKAAWKPFGNGMRACIGRPFAWQEALLVTAMLLQSFNFQLDDPNYELQIKQSLTIKPKDFYMRATLRDGIDPTHLDKILSKSRTSGKADEKVAVKKPDGKTEKPKTLMKPMSIFFGSNTGTCESLAQKLATNAVAHGFDAVVAPLDSATQRLPKGQPSVIITASYEGLPPDNAAHFTEWLKSLSEDEAKECSFAVFGCGHKDWAATYQRIPVLIDELLAARGGTKLTERGSADASQGDMFNEFDSWEDDKLWPAIASLFGMITTGERPEPTVQVEISTQKRSSYLRSDVRGARILESAVLTSPGAPEKRHLKIQLPTGMAYRAGDYLAVLPVNPPENIRRVMKRFQLPRDATLTISSGAPTVLPTDRPISAHDVLAAYVELAQPATRKNLSTLSALSPDVETKSRLEQLASVEVFTEEITRKRVSPLDLLERYPTLPIALGDFLSMLPPMRVRQYSISSSPLLDPQVCTVTYSVLDQDAFSGQGRHVGVASNYLSTLEKGDYTQVSVRPSAQPFHLPLDTSGAPVIMVCAGTGIAPFRGFVEERAEQIKAGRRLARALLFVGCRDPDKDRLYAEEFNEWEKLGAVELRYAFSRKEAESEGCKYVQDRMLHDWKDLVELWDAGAKVYVCGNSAVGDEVGKVCKEMYRRKVKEKGLKEKLDDEVEEWFAGVRKERFATDVFA